MKKLIFTVSLFLSAAASADSSYPTFSAFTRNNVLHITLMGDCNDMTGSLVVPYKCNKNRLEEIGAMSCDVELLLSQTTKGCPEIPDYPQVVTIDLESTELQKSVEKISLKSGDQVIEVGINK